MTFERIFLSENRPTISFEYFPPKKVESIVETTALIKSMVAEFAPQFITITYGAGGVAQDGSRKLLEYSCTELEVPVVAHLTCVGHSRSEIDQILDEYEQLGVRYILALRGDPPSGRSSFEAHPDGFSCARDLVRHIARRGGFSIAVAAYPEGHKDAKSIDEEMYYLREKVDAGASLILTQLFFDNSFFYKFLDRFEAAGIKVPVSAGIMPIVSAAGVKRMTTLCGATLPTPLKEQLESIKDDQSIVRFGVSYAQTQCSELIKNGVRGVHFYTLNKKSSVGAVLARIIHESS